MNPTATMPTYEKYAISWDADPVLLPEAPSYAAGAHMKPSIDFSQFYVDEPFSSYASGLLDAAVAAKMQAEMATVATAAMAATHGVQAMVTSVGGWDLRDRYLRAAVPRQFDLRHLDYAMHKVVGRVGAGHRSGTASTMAPDNAGLRCIQGELLLALGYGRDEALPGSYEGVAMLLSPEDRKLRAKLHPALCEAQRANDQRQRWGDIQKRFSLALAA